MLMVCKKENRYGGKKRSFGDEAEIHRNDVRLVSALGWFIPIEEKKETSKVKAPKRAEVRREDPPPVIAAAVVAEVLASTAADETCAVSAEQEADVQPGVAEDDPKPKRTYKRRDLIAES